MTKLDWKLLARAAALAGALLLVTGSLAAQSGGGQPGTPPPAQKRAPARVGPHVTGTVILWNGNRIDLKTREGKTQKVAVNARTKRLIEIEEGAEVTVEYRRKVGGFVIAERIRAAGEAVGATTPPPAAESPNAVTGSVVSWDQSAVVLRTAAGDDVMLFLSPRTEYLVKSMDPGTLVTVEYREGSDHAKIATRVLAGKQEDPPRKEGGSE